jgi:hypothetical protein
LSEEDLGRAFCRWDAGRWNVVTRAEWRNPEDVKASYPKANILKAGRVVFNIKGNDAHRPRGAAVELIMTIK